MTEQGQRAAKVWRDPDFVTAWASNDAMGDLLAFPRHLAAALVAHDNPDPRLVIDIGSGPGAFLATFLDEFPRAHGIWSDASEPMLARARDGLAAYGDRVEYRLADMTGLDSGDIPGGADVVMTSRAAHHLDRSALRTFYAKAAERLVPGGWLVNLDHVGPADVWDRRFRAVRPRFIRPQAETPQHHHNYPLTGTGDHLDAFARAGLTDVEIAWKAFYTCLFMARKDG
ncbi:MAG TPA: class I SAM-dependent methyltransferase [Actinomycetes bacterium]|jgi:SAM-dependent methyltransferase|nr:class I SAM-dependent methyltransferase [Actinomycetes bacterium]